MCDLAAALSPASHGLSGWTCMESKATTRYCGWSSVTCYNGRISSIDLSYLGLTGTIPSSIVNLSFLTRLNFYYNRIGGRIPPGLSLLSKLSYLDLRYNSFSGAVPDDLPVHLQSLYLSYNNLNGTIPSALGNISGLQYLTLDHNSISGSIPIQLCHSSSLYQLYLSNAHITCVPSCLLSISYTDVASLPECHPKPSTLIISFITIIFHIFFLLTAICYRSRYV